MGGDEIKKKVCAECKECPCPGKYFTYIQDLKTIKPFTETPPSPFPLVFIAPSNFDAVFDRTYSWSEMRSWLKEAAAYHGVPYELAAAIIQQENGPNATERQKRNQFAERALTTIASLYDELFFDIAPDKFPQWVPVPKLRGKNLADGSAGIANMTRPALKSAADYIEKVYCRPVIPAEARKKLLALTEDTRISGFDLKADLYYMTAHIRQLIDRVMGDQCYEGLLTRAQVGQIATAYNGQVKYGNDTLERIRKAEEGIEPLYFYE